MLKINLKKKKRLSESLKLPFLVHSINAISNSNNRDIIKKRALCIRKIMSIMLRYLFQKIELLPISLVCIFNTIRMHLENCSHIA